MFRLTFLFLLIAAVGGPGSVILWMFAPELGTNRVFSIYLLWLSFAALSLGVMVNAFEESFKKGEGRVIWKRIWIFARVLTNSDYGFSIIATSVLLVIFSFDLNYQKELSIYLIVISLCIGGLGVILNTLQDLLVKEDK